MLLPRLLNSALQANLFHQRCLSNIKGIIPPITTPFDAKGNILYDKLASNIASLNETELSGVTLIGSNGEYPLVSPSERIELVRHSRKALRKDKVLVSGAGCETSKMTIEQLVQLADAGADAILLRAPHYYKTLMNDTTFKRFYTEVADASPLPIILYNIPPYTGIDLSVNVVTEMAKHENVIGLKESGGCMAKISTILAKTKDLDFKVFVGSGSLLLSSFMAGGKHCIASLTGLLPRSTAKLYSLMENSKFEEALEMQRAFIPLNDLIAKKSCSSAYKYGLDLIGLYGGPVRPPLEDLTESQRKELKTLLDQYKAHFGIY